MDQYRILLIFLAIAWIVSFPGQASPLSDLAATMRAGSWSEIQTKNIKTLLEGNSNGNVLPFAQTGLWDPMKQQLHFIGSDHGGEGKEGHYLYDASSNSWSKVGTVPIHLGHGYDHAAMDVTGRRLFIRKYGYNTIRSLFVTDLDNPVSWKFFDEFPPAIAQVAIAIAYAKPFGLIVYNCGALKGGQLAIYNNGRWRNIRNIGGASTYHCIIEYSARHKSVIFGGGNENPRRLFRLDTDYTITPLSEAPVGIGVQQANITVDPTTGDILVLGNGEFWSINPLTDKWTRLKNTRTPPNKLGDPARPKLDNMISASISDLGVNLYIQCNRRTNCVTFVYQHAAKQ